MPYMERRTWTREKGVVCVEKYYCYQARPEGVSLRELRAGREKESPEDLKRRNARRRERETALRIAHNFREGDPYLTLTYDEEHLPKGEGREERARKDLRNFLLRLARRYRRAGKALRYVATPENVAEKKRGRPHFHVLLPALLEGATDRELERIFSEVWKLGRVHVRQYGGEIRDAARLAAYFGKESRADGGARIRFSANCGRPTVKKRVVTRSACFSSDIVIPKGYCLVKELTYQGFTRDGYPCQTIVLERTQESGARRRRRSAFEGVGSCGS